ncbi:MAG TPA: amino acid adenylation domain-containing protein, partial [Longimicrobiaceae bacterium]|nr:amino acid adenylation domain-containing protein [Longimicrobiaceae bacterium]
MTDPTPAADPELLPATGPEPIPVDVRLAPAADRPRPGRVHEWLAEQAARAPDALALLAGEERLTRGEVDARADALALRLRAYGVAPETPVALCLEASPELVVGALAIWKAGGVLVPLDPAYPHERLRFVLEDSGAALLLTTAALREQVPEHAARVLLLDDPSPDEAVSHSRTSAPPRSSSPDPGALAYVIYTSGSTGTPKGVAVEHGGLAVTLLASGAAFGLGVDDVMPALASHAFDIWLFETFAPLLAGGAVRLVPRERVRDPEALVDALGDATLLHAVPALMREVAAVAAARGAGALPRLRSVFVGGDAVAPELLERMREAFPQAAVHVLYGPTEGTIICAAYPAPDAGGTPGTMVGRPLPGVALHVCDEAGEPIPDSAEGELHIGGPGVARGYLGRPDATAEKFVPDPFSGDPGARLYRTGDRVRRTEGGDLVFLGRVDRQVKIRGFRIEPGEVEGVLLRHPGVRDAAVVAREDVPGNPRLVGYVVPAAGAQAAPGELRAWLAERLPEHLVPSALVVLDRLPLTPTGKTDRRALPAPERAADGERVAPRTPTEALLAGIWTETLGVERVGARDDFWELGGHSLLAARVGARVREALGVELPVRALFDAPTVETLAAEVERARGGVERARIPAPARVAEPGDAPLSFAQERLWVVDALDAGSPAYNKLLAFRLQGWLDAAALRRALDALSARHESLRTVFPTTDGHPVQRVLPPRPIPLPVEDLAGLPAATREQCMLRRAGEEARRPFRLAREPQLRGVVLRLGDEEHVLLLATHHIVTDGWSLAVLFHDLGALYSAAVAGGEPELPALPVRYVDYALWQRSWLAGETLERQLAYWRERLAGAPAVLEMPTDRPRPAVRSGRGLTLRFPLPEATIAAVRSLGRREGATLFMALAAAWQLLLGRWAGQDDLVVGTPVAGRTHRELEELVGFFVNTLPLRGDLSGDPDFRALLARVREVTLGAHAHQDVPFERLVEELRVERSPGRNPLFQAMLVLQNTPADELHLPGATLERFEVETGTAKFDLLLEATERGGGLECALEYSTELFDPSTAERIAAQLGVLLARAIEEPGRPVHEIDILPPAERTQVLEGWNATRGPYPERACVHHLFAEQAARTPEAVAVAYDGGALSYAELDARANRLARRLRGMGVGPDVRVGLCLERGPQMMVGVLGILKAGGAYVPLDPAYPTERLAFMLLDSGARVLLTQAELLGRLPEFGGEVVLAGGGGEDAGDPRVPVDPDNLAYVIYTSGSTGRPKGVAMTHRPLVNLLDWQGRDWRGPRAAATLQFATISFDASFHEVFSAWGAGGRVVLIPEELRYDPAKLLETTERQGVERLFMPAVALQHLAEAGDARGLAPSRLREVQTAGEQLRVTEPLRRWLRALGAPLHNHYGPSETHVVTTHALEGDPAAWPPLPPIGRPIANTACYVLDGALLPAPVGVAGELYVGGVSLARGYLDRPDATAEKFVPDPYRGEAGARMYRTGDRVRWLADGTLEFLGRADTQVKIRGFRIEPGEVEVALEAHPGVREAVVVAREDAPGEKRLVAYVVPEDGAEVGAAELREGLKERLPEYMVPSVVVPLEALPLTSSGKVDRLSLPAPQRADEAERFVAPRTPTEEILAGIWAAVLKTERVGARDDFFALGGHSLVGTQVVARVREAFRVELPLRALFEAPTVEGLAVRVERARAESAGVAGPALRRAPRDRPLPLSFSQQRLWFIDQLQPGNPVYNLARVLRLRVPAAVPTLRRALAEIVRRHEPLRTVFADTDAGPVQVVAPAGAVPLPVVDLAGLPESRRGAEALRRLSEAVLRPFDLRRGPLLRCLLVRESEQRSTLLVCMHHIVSDGWSMGVFFRELAALHEAFAAGLPSPLPEPEVQYADWALWQQRRLTGAVLEEQLGYWTERLAGAPALLELPTDHPRPSVPAGRGATLSRVLPRAGAEALRALARREGVTLFMTLLAAFDVLLARWSGQEDVVVGTPAAGRGRREVEGLIGFFVNTLALRVDVSGDPTFRELLARVRETVLGAHAHQDLPFERLVEALQPERSLAHTPVFQVVLSAEGAAVLPPAFPGGEVGELYLDEEVSDFDLGFRIQERDDGLRLLLHYRTDLFDAATTERLLDAYVLLLGAAVADTERRVLDLPLLHEEERRLLERWGAGPERGGVGEEPVGRRVEERARLAPDVVAVLAGGERLTYAELDARATRLARRLLRRGVRRGSVVGVFLERGAWTPVAPLAVWKAGGVYLPLDPGLPSARLAFLLDDSGARVVLSEPRLAGALPGQTAETLLVDAAEDDSGAPELPPPPAPDDVSYLIYTSGSTGRPKAVMVAHAQLAHTLAGAQEVLGFRPGDELAALAPVAFDISLLELLAPLAAGASVRVLGREQVPDPEALVEAAREATVLHAVPALMRQVVRAARERGGLPRARLLLTGGDLVPPDLLEELRAAFPAARVRVLYGPTEAAIICSAWEVPAEGAVVGHPIGAPLPGVRLRVCDARGEPVPVGVPGEIRVSGSGVALGYLGWPELTADRFVPAEEGRAYRTGDRGRWRADGVLEFLGRLDEQVKVRGFRIEPGEVEAALLAHPGVREAVVAVRDVASGGPGERRLVAYYTPGEAPPTPHELREHLLAGLPEYMVPAAFVRLEAMPLSPNGKLDRRALPAPAPDPARVEEYVAPRTFTEEALAAVWAEVLGVERVGVTDNFFELGGHSLLATRLASRARAVLGTEVRLRALFEAQTVEALAARVEADRRAAGEPALPPLFPADRSRPLPLSFAQERLWFLHRL